MVGMSLWSNGRHVALVISTDVCPPAPPWNARQSPRGRLLWPARPPAQAAGICAPDVSQQPAKCKANCHLRVLGVCCDVTRAQIRALGPALSLVRIGPQPPAEHTSTVWRLSCTAQTDR